MVCLTHKIPDRLAYCDHFIRLRVDSSRAQPEYIRFVANSGTGRRYIESVLVTSAGQKTINKTSLFELSVALPSITEQAEIVRRVEALFKLADRIEARHTATHTQAQRLTSLLLAKAFRGELVPQDPNDEPASELLVRLFNTRTATASSLKKNRKKKEVELMNKKAPLLVIDALRAANGPLTAKALLVEAGYPADANTELIERFFLDIRNELENCRIERVRRGIDDVFSLVK